MDPHQEEVEDVPPGKDADTYLTTMVKRVQDGTYVDVARAHGRRVRRVDRALARGPREEGTLKPSTGKSYRSTVAEHLKPAFGAYRSDRFTLGVVEAWRAGIAEKIWTGTLAPKFYVPRPP